MKTLTFLLVFTFLIPFTGIAQTTITYDYDASGNRTLRTIPLKSTAGKNNQDLQEPGQEFKDKLENKDILIYPNPVKSELTIAIPNLEAGEFAVISLHSQDGKLLFINDKATSSSILNLSDYAMGMYYLIIKIGDKKTEWKIIKE